MNSKKVLAILGSPRADGVTATMLDYSIREAEKAGYIVSKINLYEKQISFCTGCRRCLDSGMCIQKDDMQEIVLLFHESQIVLLAAPTYWANVPAPVKNLFDRFAGNGYERNCNISRTSIVREKIYALDRLQYASPIFVVIWTEQGSNTKHGRIFQNRWDEVNGESSLCKYW